MLSVISWRSVTMRRSVTVTPAGPRLTVTSSWRSCLKVRHMFVGLSEDVSADTHHLCVWPLNDQASHKAGSLLLTEISYLEQTSHGLGNNSALFWRAQTDSDLMEFPRLTAVTTLRRSFCFLSRWRVLSNVHPRVINRAGRNTHVLYLRRSTSCRKDSEKCFYWLSIAEQACTKRGSWRLRK